VPALPLEMAVVEWGLEKKVKTHISMTKTQETNNTQAPKAKIQTTPKSQEPDIAASEAVGDVEEVYKKWAAIMRGVKPHNHSLEALLRAARPIELIENRLTIEVFYTFHKEQLELDRHRRILEMVMSEILGLPLKLTFVLGKKVKAALKNDGEQVVNVTGDVADESLVEAAEEIFGK
jgi:hypothetical protein